MRVEQLGDGVPEIAVVGGIHGDEPCGVRAIERLAADAPAVEKPVKLVVANERAVERDVRYVETDLNRAFPGDPDGQTHERRLAHRLEEELGGCKTLAFHSTQSYGKPFAVVQSVDAFERQVCRHLSVETVVETTTLPGGRIFRSVPRTIEVECGYQRSAAATENAVLLAREFLEATGALPGEATAGEGTTPVFSLRNPIPKRPADSHEVYASNFEEVAAGEQFAAADGDPVVADEPFYPVLLSANGYEDVFGYAAERVDEV